MQIQSKQNSYIKTFDSLFFSKFFNHLKELFFELLIQMEMSFKSLIELSIDYINYIKISIIKSSVGIPRSIEFHNLLIGDSHQNDDNG